MRATISAITPANALSDAARSVETAGASDDRGDKFELVLIAFLPLKTSGAAKDRDPDDKTRFGDDGSDYSDIGKITSSMAKQVLGQFAIILSCHIGLLEGSEPVKNEMLPSSIITSPTARPCVETRRDEIGPKTPHSRLGHRHLT
jgi:hypothetical protein